MTILERTDLKTRTSMKVGGQAAYEATIETRMDLLEALSWAQARKLPVVMIGGGTNIIWRDEGFQGLLLINAIKRYEEFDEDGTNVYLTIGSGEIWDSVVEKSVAKGLTGIEALSLIPGTAGATPIQNVGAYGQEIATTLTTVEAFDTKVGDFITLPASECGFGYRMSRFNSVDKGRFYITGMSLHLTKGNPAPPFYGAVQTYFDAYKITEYTPQMLRSAVIAIRTIKLPDPKTTPNTGSFFGNPVIPTEQFAYWAANYDAIPHWSVGQGSVKLSAAWLIEQSGFKDYHDDATGMATWPKQALVLVNEHAKSAADVLAFRDKIIAAVKTKFNITLRQEPELLP